MSTADDFIVLAAITGAHGTKGAVKIRPFAAEPESLFTYALHDRKGHPIKLSKLGEAKGQLICQVQGIGDRNAAEKLKGTELGAPRSALPAPADDEFYHEDLIGMAVQFADGSPYGTVKAVHNFGAGDVIEIATDTSNELYSFTDATFPEVNYDERRLVIQPPEILAPLPKNE